MSLKRRLIEQIIINGPITVADYMQQCLFDPLDGYYVHHAALGEDGDFVTAPLISQMFGEMLGLWVAQMWANLGGMPIRVVEIGGGDGTLMSDMRRVMSRIRGLEADILMVDPSPRMRDMQRRTLGEINFASAISDIPTDRPVLIIANEVLDCLPVRQFERRGAQMFERMVGAREAFLVFGLRPLTDDLASASNQDDGVYEISSAQLAFASDLCDVIRAASGAALLIDYGRDAPGPGDTLQSLFRHHKTDPLEAPGLHDLTVWADFPRLQQYIRTKEFNTSVITHQGSFLNALGLGARAHDLATQNPDKADIIKRQYDRLIGPEAMGDLFKVLAFAWPPQTALASLEALP